MTTEEYLDMLDRRGLTDRLQAIRFTPDTVAIELYPLREAGRSSSVVEPPAESTREDPLREAKELLPNASFPTFEDE